MPRKALAGPVGLIIVVASVWGCGGGESTSSSGGAEGDSGANTPAKLRELQKRADAVRAQRRQAAAGGAEGSKQGSSEGTQPQTQGKQPQTVEAAHADSGGGARQFRTEGDNSIQEFGQEADAAARGEAAAVLHEYLDARVDGRWETACSVAAASLVASLEHVGAVVSKGRGASSCPKMLAAFGRGATGGASSRVAEVDVGSLRVEGERGFVLFHGPGGIDYAMPMVREAGLWKIGSLEGAPLP